MYPRKVLPKETVDWYEDALTRVVRFRNPEFPAIAERFAENDLTHTLQTIALVHQFKGDCPEIAQYLGQEKLLDLELMLYVHEAGEPWADDMPLSIENLSEMENRAGKFARYLLTKIAEDVAPEKRFGLIRKKLGKREHKIFSSMVLPCFPAPMHPRIYGLYYRFEELETTDLVANLANFWDKLDGNQTAAREYINKMRLTNCLLPKYDQAAQNGMDRIMIYAQQVVDLLPLPLRQPWGNYVEQSFSFYTIYGYRPLAKKELESFFQKNNLSSQSLGKSES